VDDHALQRIAAAVTPAVMVSACGLLALGLDNQAARMTTRLRDLAREFRSISGGQTARCAALRVEVTILARRHRFYVWALLCNYCALLSFVGTSLLALAAGVSEVPTGLPLLVFSLGVVLLALMAMFTLLAIRLSRVAIRLEEEEVLREPN
jgi:cell division protein FtsB